MAESQTTRRHSTTVGEREARFAENLRLLREARELSQGELARAMQAGGYPNFHTATVSRVEAGQRPVRLGEAFELASILRVDLADLLAAGAEEPAVCEPLRERTREVRRTWLQYEAMVTEFRTIETAVKTSQRGLMESQEAALDVLERWLAKPTEEAGRVAAILPLLLKSRAVLSDSGSWGRSHLEQFDREALSRWPTAMNRLRDEERETPVAP